MAILKFTLDTNCIFEVDEGRPNAVHVQRLVQAHKDGFASVALIAMSASESQKSGMPLSNFAEFEERTTALGFSGLEMTYPMLIADVTYWDSSLAVDEQGMQLDKAIQAILFPNIPHEWAEYCSAQAIDTEELDTAHFRKWRNALCDVQAYWAHVNAKRDVFVTQDSNFLKSKKEALLALGGGRIETPDTAAALVDSPPLEQSPS